MKQITISLSEYERLKDLVAQTDTTPDTSDSTTTDAQPEDDPVAHAIYRTICGRG